MDTDAFQLLGLDLVIKSTVVLVMALVILRVWKRASAAQGNCIWSLVFAVLLMLPVTRLITPHWSLSWNKEVPVEMKHIESSVVKTEATPVQNTIATSAVPPTVTMPDPATLVMSLWMVGVVALLGYRLTGSFLLARCVRRSSFLMNEDLAAMVSSLAASCGVTRSIQLRISEDCPVPVTWGTVRPVVMLPGDFANWPTEWLEAALRHEMGHIQNFDHLKRWITFVASVLYWPHPLVWLAARQFHIAQEEASDNLVLDGGVGPRAYAAQLLEVIRSAAGRRISPLPVLAMARRSTVEGRIGAILDEARNRQSSGRRFVMAGGALAIIFGIVLGMVQLRAEVSEAPMKKEAAVSATSSKPNVELEFHLFLIDEKIYSEQKAAINAAMEKSDLLFFVHLQGTSLIGLPSVTTHEGEKAVVDLIREFRYAVSFDKDKDGKMAPTAFKTRELGLSILTTPKLTADGRNLDLSFFGSLTSFSGWVPVSPGVRQPVFDTRRLNTMRLMGPKGAAVWLGSDPMVNVPPDGIDPGPVFSLKDSHTPKRPLVFISWKAVPPEATVVPADQHGLMARVVMRFFQISEKTYAEQATVIDDALHRGDEPFLRNLSGFRLLAAPAVLVKMGQQGVVEAIHRIPYAPKFDAGEGKTRNCGLRVVLTPSLAADGTISLNLFPEITSYEGSVKNAVGQEDPIWNTRRVNATISFFRGKPYGLWVGTAGADMSKIMSWVNPGGTHEDIFNLDPTPVRIGMIVTTELYTQEGKKVP